MNDLNDFSSLVQNTLMENWNNYRQPLIMDKEDLQVGIELFTKIAIETIYKECSVQESESIGKQVSQFSLGTESLNEIIDKIKAFVKDKAYDFRITCQTGFPFALLKNYSIEASLKQSLQDYDSILSHFMKLEGSTWLSEEELNRRFDTAFQRLQISEISKACADFKQAYVRKGDNKAGYYLLWLIKQASGCTYDICEKDSFNNSTVANTLSEFLKGFNSLTNEANFVEILQYRGSRLDKFLYQEFLDQKSSLIFLNFLLIQLQIIPMKTWPNKANVITELLETITSESKLVVAKKLESSQDPITAKIGEHVLAALKALSLREAIPHLNALVNLLPNFNYTHVEIIFGYPFIEFRENKFIYKNDPEFTKRLHFNDIRKVFIHHSLMIGVYDTRTTYGGKGVPPYLLAYDMNTEQLVWGVPLTLESLNDFSLNTSAKIGPAKYLLNQVGDLLSLQFHGEKKLRFIDPDTGEIHSTLDLPEASKPIYDSLHISPKGFAYQMVNKDQNRILIGGKIINNQWNPLFESKAPNGFFQVFSTHCGFEEDSENELVLFGPTGDQIKLLNCISAQAQDDKLYSIEKNSPEENKCFLTIRTLTTDSTVVSKTEKTILIDVKAASFVEICQHGQIILFSKNNRNLSPIFIDLNSQKVTYSKHKFPSDTKYIINTDSAEIWTWNQTSKEIWKISSIDTKMMGSMESGRGTTLLHVDKNDQLYFVDIPF